MVFCISYFACILCSKATVRAHPSLVCLVQLPGLLCYCIIFLLLQNKIKLWWWFHPTHHPKPQLDQFSRLCTADATFSLYVTLRRPIPSPPPKKRLTLGNVDSYLMHGFSEPPDPALQTASRSTQLLFSGIHGSYQRTDRRQNRHRTRPAIIDIFTELSGLQCNKRTIIYLPMKFSLLRRRMWRCLDCNVDFCHQKMLASSRKKTISGEVELIPQEQI